MIFDQLQAELRGDLPPVPMTSAAALPLPGQDPVLRPQLKRRKPGLIETVQLTGTNLYLAADWCGGDRDYLNRGVWLKTSTSDETLVPVGEWIIRSAWGEFYPATQQGIESGYEDVT